MSNRSNEFIHIPTPGNHYSPRTGSAISTIIYEITRQHEQTGGQTKVIVGAGTYSGYEVGDRVEVKYGSSLAEWQRVADIAGAKVGVGRQFSKMLYSHANAAIPRNFNGAIFVHNSPNALPMLRRDHSEAQICLWANNKLFRTHSKTEIKRIAESADTFICCSQFIANDAPHPFGRMSGSKCYNITSLVRGRVSIRVNDLRAAKSKRMRRAAATIRSAPRKLATPRFRAPR